ncbi:MAG: hypothetical protein ACREN6_00975 [Gemmatimonadaceae bacterium]
MIAILGAGHYFHAVRDGESLPPLDERLRAVRREHFRRIDRLIELALMGSGECVAGNELAPECGLYISSGVGPIGSNVIVQDAVSRDAKLPMPFNFVNTLGSSAGYYVGKNLGLSGESIFISRRGAAFAAALACAAADLASGVVSQMLVGAIEECLLPAPRFRALLGLPPDAVTAEGSHWLLLGSVESEGTPVPRESIETGEFDGYEACEAAALTSFVLRNPGSRFGLSLVNGARAELVAL